MDVLHIGCLAVKVIKQIVLRKKHCIITNSFNVKN